MKQLFLYPDVFLIGIFSLLLLFINFALTKFKSPKQYLASFLLALLITPATLFIFSQKSCGTESCFYHGWPHFLYIAYGSPTFNVIQTLSFPIYFLINILFYFSLFSLVRVIIKKLDLKRN